MRRVSPLSTCSSNTTSASSTPAWGRAGSTLSIFTVSAGRPRLAGLAGTWPVSGSTGGAGMVVEVVGAVEEVDVDEDDEAGCGGVDDDLLAPQPASIRDTATNATPAGWRAKRSVRWASTLPRSVARAPGALRCARRGSDESRTNGSARPAGHRAAAAPHRATGAPSPARRRRGPYPT